MADIFISYSKADRLVAQALADDLTNSGFTVWWDTNLYAGDDFHDTIRTEIARAKAVIVIWSDAAVASQWVRGEAAEAAEHGSLISTHVPGFDPRRMPINHRAVHCEPVTNRRQIIVAIESKGRRELPPFENGLPEHLRVAASRGDTSAMCLVACLYTVGHGVPKDPTRAAEWYETAAVAGNAHAMCNTGFCYEAGEGVRKDYAKARRWYEKSAANGETEAMLAMANLYKTGKGVPKSVIEAAKWYERARAAGHKNADKLLRADTP